MCTQQLHSGDGRVQGGGVRGVAHLQSREGVPQLQGCCVRLLGGEVAAGVGPWIQGGLVSLGRHDVHGVPSPQEGHRRDGKLSTEIQWGSWV
jgi:hypothetical protein